MQYLVYVQQKIVPYKYTGGGLELVDAVGVVVIGHFSLDGQLKKEHYTQKHHNMFIIENRRELTHELMNLFSFTGQTVVEIVTETHYSGTNAMHFVCLCSTIVTTQLFI